MSLYAFLLGITVQMFGFINDQQWLEFLFQQYYDFHDVLLLFASWSPLHPIPWVKWTGKRAAAMCWCPCHQQHLMGETVKGKEGVR